MAYYRNLNKTKRFSQGPPQIKIRLQNFDILQAKSMRPKFDQQRRLREDWLRLVS